MIFTGIGPEGQRRLLASRATIVGCGAIGTASANLLARAGVGALKIIDRDFVEPSNLQRQTLFEESDARDALPKAVAAERKLLSSTPAFPSKVWSPISPLTMPRTFSPAAISFWTARTTLKRAS